MGFYLLTCIHWLYINSVKEQDWGREDEASIDKKVWNEGTKRWKKKILGMEIHRDKSVGKINIFKGHISREYNKSFGYIELPS